MNITGSNTLHHRVLAADLRDHVTDGQLQLTATAQNYKTVLFSISLAQKHQNSKSEVSFLLNAYRFCINIKLKNSKSEDCL